MNGDGEIDVYKALLRTLANEVFSAINEQGDIWAMGLGQAALSSWIHIMKYPLGVRDNSPVIVGSQKNRHRIDNPMLKNHNFLC